MLSLQAYAQLFFFFETGSPYIAQAALEPLGSESFCLNLQIAGTIELYYCAQLISLYYIIIL
jgi:hypothetical protein